MSQYPPPNGYGHHRGQPPPQQHSYEPLHNYPPPTYNGAHNPSVIDLTGAPIQNAFNYHANRIPGLRIGGGVDDNHIGNTTDSHVWAASVTGRGRGGPTGRWERFEGKLPPAGSLLNSPPAGGTTTVCDMA